MRRLARMAVIFLIWSPLLVAGATFPSDSSGLQIDVSPRYPVPGQSVTFTVANYAGSSDSATYSWNVNGKKILSGIGEKTATLQAGALGSSQIVSVSVTDGGGLVGTVSATIRPSDVDVLWEARTVHPPFYIGRPLPNAGSSVTVEAIPHLFSGGGELSPTSLIYLWTENGEPLPNVSGFGKHSITVTPPNFGEPFSISVHVENLSGTLAAESATTISPVDPQIAVYEYAPLLGIRFEKNVANLSFPFSGDEISFSAFPFNINNLDQPAYQWAIDANTFAVDPARPRDVTFRKNGSAKGNHEVTFSFDNTANFLEQAGTSFRLSI